MAGYEIEAQESFGALVVALSTDLAEIEPSILPSVQPL